LDRCDNYLFLFFNTVKRIVQWIRHTRTQYAVWYTMRDFIYIYNIGPGERLQRWSFPGSLLHKKKRENLY
jgi:hypothetical protein